MKKFYNVKNKITLLDAQKKFIEIPHDYTLDVAVYQGGFGSGKTFAGSLLGILLCLKYPKITGLVGALTYPLVRDTTLVSYLQHLSSMGFIDKKDYKFYKTEQKLVFKNGSQVLFRHFQEPAKLKSLNLGFVQIEEMSDVNFSVFKMLLGRLRQRIRPQWKDFQYRLFAHTNPQEEKGWIYKTFAQNPPPNYRLIIAPTTQNIYLPQNFCEELKKIYDEKYYKMNVLGEWGDYAAGKVVKNFNYENIKEIKYNADLPLHISCDFNVDPMCWELAHVNDKNIYFFDEIAQESTTTAFCVDLFAEKYKRHRGPIVINGDASGDNRSCTSEFTNYVIMRNRLLKYGFQKIDIQIKPFNPPIKNRILAFNSQVLAFDGTRHLFVDRKCEKLLYNIENLSYKEGTSRIDVPSHHQIKQNSELKFLSHPFDAASYLVDYYFPPKL